MQSFGIDVSKWQGNFNFETAKINEKIEFVIIKAGGGDNVLYKDSKFESNYAKCEALGIPKGAYFFGRAVTVEAAKKEAEYFLKLIKGKKFEYPVYYDVEAKMLTETNRDTLTEVVKTFCSIVEKAGYWVGIYSSESAFTGEMNDKELSKYSHWVARWGKNKPFLKYSETQMWQFGGETNLIRSNKINGQSVDQNYCYVDYPDLIKKKGLNGYAKEVKEEVKPILVPKQEVKYTVKKGDNLTMISNKFGVPVKKLVELNKIKNPNLIIVGQVLKIK